MTQDQDLAQLQTEINALKRQMRQLLEVMAVMQEHAGNAAHNAQRSPTPHEETGAPAAPTEQRAAPNQAARLRADQARAGTGAPPPAGNQAMRHVDTPPVQEQERQPDVAEVTLAPLYAENARLVDLVRAQAEEIGALRERVRRLEDGSQQGHESLATSLRALLHALSDTP